MLAGANVTSVLARLNVHQESIIARERIGKTTLKSSMIAFMAKDKKT
jgi:hypothetical protein